MKPIVTLTLNPSIDLAFRSAEIKPYSKIRTAEQRIDAGGGGINVARVAKELGAAAQIVYLAGGATGIVLDDLLDAMAVPRRRIDIAGSTRISVTVAEEVSGMEYRFVTEGCSLLEEEWQAALSLVKRCDADHVVASGSIPPGVPVGFYAQLSDIVREKGARLIVDTSGPALEAAVSAGGIYLAKPSLSEFQTLTGRKFESAEALADAAKRFVDDGSTEILAVTLGRDGALLAHRSGTLRLKGPKVKPVSAVGAGDSFVAAMTVALAQGRDVEDAFLRGMAAGAAAVLTPGTQLCRRDDVDRLYSELAAELAQANAGPS